MVWTDIGRHRRTAQRPDNTADAGVTSIYTEMVPTIRVGPLAGADAPEPGGTHGGTVKLSGTWRVDSGPVDGRNELTSRQVPLCRPSLPAKVISQAVWLYFRFPLGLRMVEEVLVARGIVVSHEAIRQICTIMANEAYGGQSWRMKFDGKVGDIRSPRHQQGHQSLLRNLGFDTRCRPGAGR